MEQQQARAIIEALLLASDQPVSRSQIESVLEDEASPELIQDALRSLQIEYDGDGRGIHIERLAGGYRLCTNPELGEYIRTFFEDQPVSLSRAALETLAIIAYRQPLTRAEVEEIRGVNSSGVLKTLRECELVDIIGRLDDIGKPHLYGTTDRFLEFFGLEGLADLPTLEQSELEALVEMHEEAHLDDVEVADESLNDDAPGAPAEDPGEADEPPDDATIEEQ